MLSLQDQPSLVVQRDSRCWLTVNHTVRDLREAGMTSLHLSGDLHQCAILVVPTVRWHEVPFSELVDLAWQQGLTEPDLLLTSMVQTWCVNEVILARESGLDIEPENVKVESLVPAELQDLSGWPTSLIRLLCWWRVGWTFRKTFSSKGSLRSAFEKNGKAS